MWSDKGEARKTVKINFTGFSHFNVVVFFAVSTLEKYSRHPWSFWSLYQLNPTFRKLREGRGMVCHFKSGQSNNRNVLPDSCIPVWLTHADNAPNFTYNGILMQVTSTNTNYVTHNAQSNPQSSKITQVKNYLVPPPRNSREKFGWLARLGSN